MNINYTEIFAWRQQQLVAMRASPEMLVGAIEYYRRSPVAFIDHWVDTFDPRNAGHAGKLTYMPFKLFPKQREFIEFLDYCRTNERSGLLEKSRDMGATWLACAYSAWLWLFIPGTAVGWGSRKESLVDKLGDSSSIFEKIRVIIERLPREFVPRHFETNYMRVLNPVNGNTITGEAGDNIGRGGRNTIYFIDESAFLERPERVEASLSATTRVRIDISTPNGLGNPFQRKRESGVDWSPGVTVSKRGTAVFVMDWSDHPDKDQEWYDSERQKYEEQGLQHIFASEVDRNYAASVTNVVIPIEWIKAAIVEPTSVSDESWVAGLDVADGGADTNALALRQGVVLRSVEEWTARDVGVTSRTVMDRCRSLGQAVSVQYDCIGIGSAVRSEVNRIVDGGLLPPGITFTAWNAAASPTQPHARVVEGGMKNEHFFQNLRAQAWWSLRTRFYKTFQHVRNGVEFPVDEMINIPNNQKLIKELAQVTYGQSASLKLIIDKTPSGTKSPNLADAVVMAYFPVISVDSTAVFGTVGN